MTEVEYTKADLRSAVQSGVLTEAQAASVMAIGDARAGRRAMLNGEDEPFELFKGFADIFVSVGLILLLSGILTAARFISDSLWLPAVAAGLCWLFARYFTLKRRMTLPSIVLAIGYALGVAGTVTAGMAKFGDAFSTGPMAVVILGALVAGLLLLYYAQFKVPFVMFLVGLTGLVVVMTLTTSIVPTADNFAGLTDMFDLRQGSGLAIGTLIFGVAAFAGGMWFDMRDPYRLGRWSASGFWLHLLAAPALVNTIALTVYNFGGLAGNLLTALALVGIAALALIIDRRSFLTAGIGYLGLLISWAISAGDGAVSPTLLLLILGGFITALGTWWVPLRGWLMLRLPDFPGKTRLPPYGIPT